jgi:hypothetical protein
MKMKVVRLITGIITFTLFTQSVLADIVLPGGCQMGECWEQKLIEKRLIKSGSKGTIYAVKTVVRSGSMDSQAFGSFGEVKLSYVYCSTTKPAIIFDVDFDVDRTYYAHLLNPGSQDWAGYNQSDYPLYWATCHNFVGPDFFSEEMTAKAIKLGYPLNLPQEQIELNNVLEIME